MHFYPVKTWILVILLTLVVSKAHATGCPPSTTADLINCINSGGASGVVDLQGQTFTLTAVDNTTDGDNGLPDIVTTLTIQNGTIERDTSSPAFRIFHISSPGVLTLSNLALNNGEADSSTGGGAVYVQTRGILSTIYNTSFTNNNSGAGGSGGAIYAFGDTNITSIVASLFSGNIADQYGGAIFYNSASGQIDLIDSSVFVNNSATTASGGAHLDNKQICSPPGLFVQRNRNSLLYVFIGVLAHTASRISFSIEKSSQTH
jgi:hypothetical protein